MSDVRNYPDFAKRFMMFVFSFAGLAIISFALCFYFNGKGHETLSDIFIGLAALFTCIGLGGGSLKVFTVKCYVCRGKTKTIKNTEYPASPKISIASEISGSSCDPVEC